MKPFLVLTVVAACLAVETAEARTLGAEEACRVAKMLAAGQEVRDRLQCEARDLANGAPPACIASAAARRDARFRRAEARGGCLTVGDSAEFGQRVESAVQSSILPVLPPYEPTEARCTKRLVVQSGRAAQSLVRIYALDARAPDEAGLAEKLARARGAFWAVQARASAGGCQYPFPADYYYDAVVDGIATIRDEADPEPPVGGPCPCWTTAQLDAAFPPGAFSAMGGTSCDDGGLGTDIVGASANDGCELPPVGSSPIAYGFPRAGFAILGHRMCVGSSGDLDPDNDGTCSGPGSITWITAVEAEACIAALQLSQLYSQECALPD